MGSPNLRSELNENLANPIPSLNIKNLQQLELVEGSSKMQVPNDCLQILQYVNFVKDESMLNEQLKLVQKNKIISPQSQLQKNQRKIPNLIKKNINTISLEEFQKINGSEQKIKGHTQVHFTGNIQEQIIVEKKEKKPLSMAKRTVNLSSVQKQNKQNYRKLEQKTQIETYYQKLHNFKQCEIEQNQFNQFLKFKIQIDEKFESNESQKEIIAEYKKSPSKLNKLGPDQMIKQLKQLCNKDNYETNLLRFKSNLL